MPAPTESSTATAAPSAGLAEFPPITRNQILHCSYDYWFPKYRASCIKSRIIPLTPEFVEYLREDGIILADDDGFGADDDDWEPEPATIHASHIPRVEEVDDDSDSESDAEELPKMPPNKRCPAIHQAIIDKMAELGGAVAPKLNWTAPKDATNMLPQNTIKCTTPNDVYLLLKSSTFVTHDLENAFDNCTATASSNESSSPFNPVLVLRSYFNPHTAMEFRCFVKHRNLIGITQRDLNFYEFLRPFRADIVARVSQLFNHKLRYTFPDGSFVFDVYIPESSANEIEAGSGPLGRARLIDINPWAPQTDSLLFEWPELLATVVPGPLLGVAGGDSEDDDQTSRQQANGQDTEDDGEGEDEEDEEDEDFIPELRLIEKEDPAAYNFSSPQYSAHKMPKDVVDASLAGEGGMQDFARKWREMTEYRDRVGNWEMN